MLLSPNSLAARLIAGAQTAAELTASLLASSHGHLGLGLSGLASVSSSCCANCLLGRGFLERTGCWVTTSVSAVMGACCIGSVGVGWPGILDDLCISVVSRRGDDGIELETRSRYAVYKLRDGSFCHSYKIYTHGKSVKVLRSPSAPWNEASAAVATNQSCSTASYGDPGLIQAIRLVPQH